MRYYRHMEIYIDESGIFVASNERGSWSVVAAFSVSELAVPTMEAVLKATKASVGYDVSSEIKLKNFKNNEKAYFVFLSNIAQLDGLLFATASDSSLNSPASVIRHQEDQVRKVRENVAKMLHEQGRINVEESAVKLSRLSVQLYTQLYCQIELMHDVVDHSINYFAQRYPETLGDFKWRVDRTGAPLSAYEHSFEQMTPVLLQTMSLAKPLSKIKSKDFDYTYLNKFEIEIPDFLKKECSLGLRNERCLDLQKMIRGDMEFVDSSNSAGVQVVDLLVSGLRRCLQGGFKDNDVAAALLGSLMVKHRRPLSPINLVCFRNDGPFLDEKTERSIKIMGRTAKNMILC